MNRTESNYEVLKIELTGAPAIGKTTVGILLAKALARVFEENGLLIPISVVNTEGDWPARCQSLDTAEAEGLYGGELKLPNLRRVVIVDANKGARWQGNRYADLVDIAELPLAHVSSASSSLTGYDDIYVGSALPETSDPRESLADSLENALVSAIAVHEHPTENHELVESTSPLRTVTSHQASPLDNELRITALDERGSGNANYEYFVTGMSVLNPIPESIQDVSPGDSGYGYGIRISFQNGPIQEAGVNGVSNEALLAIVADRLEGFQSGPYACEDNGIAMVKILSAIEDLQRRTKRRLERGVEGTSQV